MPWKLLSCTNHSYCAVSISITSTVLNVVPWSLYQEIDSETNLRRTNFLSPSTHGVEQEDLTSRYIQARHKRNKNAAIIRRIDVSSEVVFCYKSRLNISTYKTLRPNKCQRIRHKFYLRPREAVDF